jgi:hypothetical protein
LHPRQCGCCTSAPSLTSTTGGGVNNAVESLLINPLSQQLLLDPPKPDEAWRVEWLIDADVEWRIEVTRC